MRVLMNIVKKRKCLRNVWRGILARGTLLYAKMTAVTTTCLKRLTEAITTARLWCTHHRGSNTSLQRFIEATGGNVAALRRRFFPSKTTLKAAADMLASEFSELCGLCSKNEIPGKNAVLTRLQVIQLQGWLDAYDKTKDKKGVMQKIRELTGICTTIKQAEAMLKTWKIKLEAEQAQLVNKQQNEQDEQKKNYMLGLVSEVSKYLGFHISLYNTTVVEFAGYTKSFHNHIEKSKQKK